MTGSSDNAVDGRFNKQQYRFNDDSMTTAQKTASGKWNETSPTLRSVGRPLVVAVAMTMAALFISGGQASADGFRLPFQDPEAVARGNAFVATADNPSAIAYNPAGITQLEGNNASFGLYAISTDDKFEAPSGATAATKQAFVAAPQIFFAKTLTNYPLSIGVGVYVPYGLSIDFGNPSFRNVAQNGSLLYATVEPVLAWKVTPELSIGGGPTINYSKVQVNQGVFADPDRLRIVGDDYALGFTAGVRWQPLTNWAFGLNYHSATSMDYKGHSTVSGTSASLGPFGFDGSNPASAALHFPQFVCVGVSYRPTEKWNLEVDVDWTDWDSVDTFGVNGNLGKSGTQIPSLVLNYHSSFLYEFGATRYLPKGWYVSTGFMYSENSTPDANLNPLIPDSDLYLFNAGFGHHGVHWGWALSYTLALNPSRTVSGSSYDRTSSYPNTSVDGTYRTLNNAVDVAVSYKF